MKSSATRGGPVFLVIKSWFTICCIKLRLLSSYLQCWKAKCVLTFNQEIAVIYMFCAYNKKFFPSICQRNWNNLWVFITYFISPKTPAKSHCSQLVDIVQQQIESRPTHTKVRVLVIQLTLLNKNNLYLGPPRSTSRSCDFFFWNWLLYRILKYVVTNFRKKSELLLVDLGGPK